VFIETGTYQGDGVRLALQMGFREIHSIELDPERFEHCSKLFKEYPQVRIHQGDSALVLSGLVGSLSERVTFWLDAHAMGPNDTRNYQGTRWPLIQEVRSLASASRRRDHVLLIDDRSQFESEFGFKESELVEAIFAINDQYQIHFEDSLYTPNNILVAAVSEVS
jgi:hypothetical protein